MVRESRGSGRGLTATLSVAGPVTRVPSALVSSAMTVFFSSRRRHTRLQGDWSSERVLFRSMKPSSLSIWQVKHGSRGRTIPHPLLLSDRKSVVEGKGVDLGGLRIIKKKNTEPRLRDTGHRLAPLRRVQARHLLAGQ